MKEKVLALVLGSCLVVLLTGCYSTIDGRTKAGIPFQKDRFVSLYERPVDQIFAAAKEVLSHNGTLYGENTIAKTLEAKVDTRTVRVKVEEVDPKTSRVTVQARKKGGTADADLASEIDKQIGMRLVK